MKKQLPKILVILGPTASGKTDLAIALAKKFNGEVVSADSRQVYKEMDIATAKPKGARRLDSRFRLPAGRHGGNDSSREGEVYLVEGVAHYLIDVVRPDKEFTLAHFKKTAMKKIDDILRRGKLPIVAGGTGLYIWALVDNLDIPAVPPDNKLRSRLEKMPLPELVKMLAEKDPLSAQRMDLKNPRRVLRALEVALSSGKPLVAQKKILPPLYNVLQIGIKVPREVLNGRINARVDQQMAGGLMAETKKLAKKYNWSLPSMSGIGYKQLGGYLRGETKLEEAVEMIKRDTRRYAKRQMTWFKRDKRIKWVDYRKAFRASCVLAQKFLKK